MYRICKQSVYIMYVLLNRVRDYAYTLYTEWIFFSLKEIGKKR